MGAILCSQKSQENMSPENTPICRHSVRPQITSPLPPTSKSNKIHHYRHQMQFFCYWTAGRNGIIRRVSSLEWFDFVIPEHWHSCLTVAKPIWHHPGTPTHLYKQLTTILILSLLNCSCPNFVAAKQKKPPTALHRRRCCNFLLFS